MDAMEAWVRFGAALTCADGQVTDAEAEHLAGLASVLAGFDESRTRAMVEDARGGRAPSNEAIVAALAASSLDAAIEGLRWCYRIVRADGVEHDAEVELLERAGARFFGPGAGARTVEFLRQDHRTILLREALEESAFAAGVRVSNGGEA